MSTVIKVEGLGKQYRLGLVNSGTLAADLNRYWSKLRGKEDPYLKIGQKNDRTQKGGGDYVWALKDINFEVKQGEVLGIIGKNGAGKSTLLKILSRVTSPTTGQIKVKGRIASLLEVGTGFHPELTGRENIYLNGAILGMSKAEIRAKFDEIVDFSGVAKYIDTPVKRYSSGMYVRLAFAVAAHLEPEILIVDEVLAVGDAEFQKKCIGKMQDVAGQGRTVLFVSHNMLSVQSLCERGVVLEHGSVALSAPSHEAVEYYQMSNFHLAENVPLIERTDLLVKGKLRFTKTYMHNSDTHVVKNSFLSGENVEIVAEYTSRNGITAEELQAFQLSFSIGSYSGETLADLWSTSTGQVWGSIPAQGAVICKLPRLPLNVGRYRYNICARLHNVVEYFILHAGVFNIEAGDFFHSGVIPDYSHGAFLFEQTWHLEGLSSE
jgi:lipopolysaccharide transport system ATP-binding protein